MTLGPNPRTKTVHGFFFSSRIPIYWLPRNQQAEALKLSPSFANIQSAVTEMVELLREL